MDFRAGATITPNRRRLLSIPHRQSYVDLGYDLADGKDG